MTTAPAQPLPVDQDTILERMRGYMADSLNTTLERRADTLVEMLDHDHFAQVITDGYTNNAAAEPPTVDTVIDVYLENTLEMVHKSIRQTALLLQRLSELAWVLGRADIAEQLIPHGHRITAGAHQCLRELVTYCDDLGIGLPAGDDIDMGRQPPESTP